jgi:hypothetical protein
LLAAQLGSSLLAGVMLAVAAAGSGRIIGSGCRVMLGVATGSGGSSGMMLGVAAGGWGMVLGGRKGREGSQSREQYRYQACSKRKHAAPPRKVPFERGFNDDFTKLSHIATRINPD